MKAVVGSVAQSKRVQLAKAASSFARFAATAGTGTGTGIGIGGVEGHAKAAYLRLASTAFEELVQIQADGGVGEMVKRRKGKRGNDGRRFEEGETSEEVDDDGMEIGEVVDSNVKRLKTGR